MTPTITANWVESAKARASCHKSLTDFELRNLSLALRAERLLARNSRALDDEDIEPGVNISAGISVTHFLERIKCGTLLSEYELLEFEALLEIEETEEAVTEAAQEAETVGLIVFHGIEDAAGAANPQDFVAADVLATDTAIATLHTIGDAETQVLQAVAGANKVTITFDGAPDAGTKVNILVVRDNSDIPA